MAVANATFYAFKPSGKWKYSGRGVVDVRLFMQMFGAEERRRYAIHELNGGKHPGMSGPADEYDVVVVPDEDAPGWPLLFKTDHKWE